MVATTVTSQTAANVRNATIRLTLLCLSLFLSVLPTMAQLKQFSLEDLIPGGKNYTVMMPKRQQLLWWGNQLIRVNDKECFLLNKENKWIPLFSLEDVQAQARKSVGNSFEISSLKGLAFPESNQPIVLIMTSKGAFAFNWQKPENSACLSKAEKGGESWQDYSHGALAYNQDIESNHNLVVTAQGQTYTLGEGNRDIVFGQSVHRDEFGINKGTFWSPDGSQLCFYRMDQSMVLDYPLVDISTRIATVQPIKYPMAGEKSHKVTMGVFSLRTQKTVWLDTGDNTDQYYAGITWSPDSKKVFLFNLNRDQNHLRLLQFDAQTGKMEKVLLEESHPKYLNIDNSISFLPWDADKFLYWSQRDGFDHIYMYSLKEGKILRKVTGDELGVVISLLGFNTKSKSLVVCATGCSPIQHNLYSVNVATGKSHLLDNGKGVHSGQLSADGTKIVDTWSSPDVPRQVDIINVSSGKMQNLFKAENPWKDYAVPEITCGSLKAADGTTPLYYRLIKPTNFNPQKKYPAIVYVYGGPHTRLVEDSWGYMFRGWEIYMAQLGYVVFVLDNRGSNERGLAFENVTFRHLGKEEMRDQMKGVDFLKNLPFVDSSRLGVHGWSYGGFMTTNMMLTYPDVFKVGVAGGPVINWSLYEVMYGERYMDTPQTNPEGYKENNLTLRAKNLKGRLLIIFGYNDPVCVPQHTLSFIRACEDAGTHPDLFTYPGDEHNMMGRDRIHLHEHITRYFEDFLK